MDLTFNSHGKMRNAYRILVENPEGKIQLKDELGVNWRKV
jgi:hypothetical protein